MRPPSSLRLATWLLAASLASCTQPLVKGNDNAVASASNTPPNEQSAIDSPLIKLTLYNSSNGDESYTLAIDGLPLSAENDSCEPVDLANVTVNGHSLAPIASAHDGAESPAYAALEGTVTASGENNRESLNISLTINAICLDRPSRSHSSPETTSQSRLFDISVVQPQSDTWFFVSVDNSQEAILNGHVNIQVNPPRPSFIWDVDSSTDSTHSVQSFAASADDVLEQETRRLQALHDELKDLQLSVDQQKTLVNKLLSEKHQEAGYKIKDCHSVGCVFSTLYHTCKKSIHLAYLRFKAMHDFSSRSPDDCFYIDPASKPVEAAMLITDKNGCKSQHIAYSGKSWLDEEVPLASGKAQKEEKRPPSLESIASPQRPGQSSQSYSAAHKVHAILALTASIFCLGCVGTMLHRRCCNPRARADRAARREERRTLRQYRCAARRQAWKDWWARQQGRFCRRGAFSSRRTNDYEEKRALIVEQEAVLENAMQHEIGRLQSYGRPHGVVGEVLTMAEEGRMPCLPPLTGSQQGNASADTEQLPAYRSRASSGRPPSYKEFDEDTPSLVADGFLNYTPSSIGNDDARSVRSFGSDATPESSIAELSPRHSSETLRTERSGV